MLFYPFRDEAGLFPDDEAKCIALCRKNQDQIQIVTARLMPILESLDEAQQLYEDNREKQERHIEEAMGADLDPEMEQEVVQVIKALADEGRTMILVTHDMNLAYEVSDHVVFLHEGRNLEEGPPQTMFRTPRSDRLQKFLKSTKITNEK